MNTLRLGLAILSLVLLAAGYAASQFAFQGFLGGPDGWAARLSQAPVAPFGLGLVAAAIVLALTADTDEREPS